MKNLHIHINRKLFENQDNIEMREDLEKIKTQLETFFVHKYEHLEEIDIVYEIRHIYNSIESIINDL